MHIPMSSARYCILTWVLANRPNRCNTYCMTRALDAAALEFDQADRLRRALRISDVSVGAMAEYLDVHRNSVTNWINGHTKVPGPVLKLWAMRCGVPYAWLKDGTVDPGDDGGASSSMVELRTFNPKIASRNSASRLAVVAA